MNSSSIRIFRFFIQSYPWRTGIVIIALFMMAIMEMVGMVTVLPMISLISDDLGEPPEILVSLINHTFMFMNLPLELPYLLGFIVVVMTLKAILLLVATWQVAVSSARVVSDLRSSLLNSILGANWKYYSSMATGGSVNALGTEALRTAEVYRHACNLLAFILLVVVYAAIALMVSWKVTLAALLAGGVISIIFLPLIKMGRHYGEQETKLLSDSSSQFNEALLSAKPIRAMAREHHYINMLSGLIKGLEISQQRKILATESIRHAAEPIIVIFVAIGLYFAVEYTTVPLTQILFLAFLFHRIATRILSAQRLFQNVIVNESALNSLRDRINTALQEKEILEGKSIPALNDAIEFKNVAFAYDTLPVFENLSARFDARKMHVIYGGSGAGKTTFVDLLIGLHRAQKGDILIDGRALLTLDLRAWRSMIGYVPQDIILFHDTIYNNVTLGDQNVVKEDVENALKEAGAWPFVQAMENGLQTVIGEGGGKISGGQRQRIAIARAIVHKPVLLILDEATSALDTDTEKEILKSIQRLAQDITVIAITHQKSVLSYADQVLRLENGEMVPHHDN